MRHIVGFAVLIALPILAGVAGQQKNAKPHGTAAPSTVCTPSPGPEAPQSFDNNSNCAVSQQDFDTGLNEFDKVDQRTPDGLGPVYNAQACRECHQDPVSGAASQMMEQRAGHAGSNGKFFDPVVHIDGDTITGRSLINDRAIVDPNGPEPVPAARAQERVPEGETIRTNRLSLNILGDGFVEAIDDQTILDIRDKQCSSDSGICGVAIWVPVVEVNQNGIENEKRLGRFGWKDQHASLLSFAADAYLNEMGITNRLQKKEVTDVDNPTLCNTPQECRNQNTVSEPNNPRPGDQPPEDIDKFTNFMRGTKAPPRDPNLDNQNAKAGKAVFERIGCNQCHVEQIKTAPAGTLINAGTFAVPAALGNKQIEPYSDFLLHDVGTGDFVAIAGAEHWGTYVSSVFVRVDAAIARRATDLRSQGLSCKALTTAIAPEYDKARTAALQEPAINVGTHPACPNPAAMGSLCDAGISEQEPDPDRAEIPFARPFYERDECDARKMAKDECSQQTSLLDRDIQCTANKLRTPPLWGLHERTRLMHDGNSVQITDAIKRHQGEARPVTEKFRKLSPQEQSDLIIFLKSL
ncbi:MAG: di-heme oxidoredictase family protein [Terriglobales bacterium]